MPLNPHTSSRARSFCLALFAIIFFAGFVGVPPSYAQTNWSSQESHELQIRPIFVTTRVFQIKGKQGAYEELSGQVFKMKTARLTEYENWLNAFKKTYPGLEAALLRTDSKRVFRTARPTIISLGKRPDGRDIEITINAAQSVGDGKTPGTTLIPEINLHFGNDRVKKPVSYAIQHLEVESGSTYYFATPLLKMNSTDYTGFVRPNAPARPFDGHDIYLIFAFSVDLDKTVKPPRILDEQQSAELQMQASKKVQPEIPAALRETGMSGYVRANVEISPEGKVSSANVHFSTFPEMNDQVIAAARQWEFARSLFAEDKNPITGYLTFNFTAANPAAKTATQKSDKQ